MRNIIETTEDKGILGQELVIKVGAHPNRFLTQISNELEYIGCSMSMCERCMEYVSPFMPFNRSAP